MDAGTAALLGLDQREREAKRRGDVFEVDLYEPLDSDDAGNRVQEETFADVHEARKWAFDRSHEGFDAIVRCNGQYLGEYDAE